MWMKSCALASLLLTCFSYSCAGAVRLPVKEVSDIYTLMFRDDIPREVTENLARVFHGKASVCKGYLCFRDVKSHTVPERQRPPGGKQRAELKGTVLIDHASKIVFGDKSYAVVFIYYPVGPYSEYGCRSHGCNLNFGLLYVPHPRAEPVARFDVYSLPAEVRVYSIEAGAVKYIYFLDKSVEHGNTIDLPDVVRDVGLTIYQATGTILNLRLARREMSSRKYGRDPQDCAKNVTEEMQVFANEKGDINVQLKSRSPCGPEDNFGVRH